MKIANAKTFGNNPYATASDVASAITSHSTNVGHIPSGGVAGEYLRKTENGTEWANAEIPNLSATIGEEWGYTKITFENVSTIASNVVESSATGFDTVTIKQSSDDAGSSYKANASNKTFTLIAGDNVTFANGDNQVTINAVGGTPEGATSANVSSIASSIASSMIDTRLTNVYTYRGSIDNYLSLPVSDQKVGDIYNIENADATHGIKAGDNVAWNGTTWDVLAGTVDLSGYADKAYKTVSVKATSTATASTNIAAASKDDTLKLVAGTGVTLTANETNGSITINGTTITAAGSDVTSIVASHGASMSNTDGKLVIDVPVDGTVTENSTAPVAGSGVFNHVSSEMTKVNSSISAVETLVGTKASIADMSQVAFTGDYNDLINKPSTFTPPSQMIDFTSADTPSVTWNSGKTEATFTHTLNCIPNVVVYDSNWELTYVTIQLGSTPNNSTFKILLDTPVVSSNAWHCIVTYGHHIS